jgi:hypothetical protein
MEDNIKLNLGWEGVEWIHLAQDRNQWPTLEHKVMNDPSGFIKY